MSQDLGEQLKTQELDGLLILTLNINVVFDKVMKIDIYNKSSVTS